jgi:hypothetical protein
MPKSKKRSICEVRCKRRGPVNANCPSIVVGIANNCREAERKAIHSVAPTCWKGGTTYGHCKPMSQYLN